MKTSLSTTFKTAFLKTTLIGTFSLFLIACGGSSSSSSNSGGGSGDDSTPAAPQNLQAQTGNAKVNLSWTAVTGASTYTVYQDSSAVQSVTTPNAEISGLTNGTEYRFTVAALNAKGESDHSSTITATPTLPAPAGFQIANVGNAQVSLSWNAVPNATGYFIYYSTGTVLAASPDRQTVGNTLSANVLNLTNFSTHTFAIRATDDSGHESALSVSVQARPVLPAPSGLSVTPGDRQITLNWNTVNNATGYRVEYGSASNALNQSITLGDVATTIARSLNIGTAYHFAIRATDSNGASVRSAPVSTTTNALPSAPQNLQANPTDQLGELSLSWQAVSNATTYNIYYATQTFTSLDSIQNYATIGGKIVQNLVATTHSLAGLSGTTYHLVVTSENANGESQASTPEITAIPRHIAQVSLGNDHACASLSDGELRCWGQNDDGQLGIGSTATQTTPTRVPTLSHPKQISMGGDHSCALGANSQLFCWGDNSDSQLGLAVTHDRLSPTTVTSIASNPPSTPTTLIQAGKSSTCAVANGRNFCWGYQRNGGLGNGQNEFSSTRTAQPLRNIGAAVRQFALGFASGCAIDSTDSLWCWGFGHLGQNGDGDNGNNLTPSTVTLSAIPLQISGEDVHYCLSNSDSNAQCWGLNNAGQLGIDSTSSQNAPRTVLSAANTTLTDVTQVAVSQEHSCALLNNGSVRCWGNNDFGQLGIDSTSTLLVASASVNLGNGNAAREIFAGGYFTCALLRDRTTLRCWGYNDDGQLGDGTTTNRHTPVPVKFNE